MKDRTIGNPILCAVEDIVRAVEEENYQTQKEIDSNNIDDTAQESNSRSITIVL